MSGFGIWSFGLGPYGVPEDDSETTPTTLVSSRAIDPVTRRYTQDDDGNPDGMDDVANRVYLALSFAQTLADIITPQALREQEAAIRRALLPLTAGKTPAIRDVVIGSTNPDGGRTWTTVTYTSALTGTRTSVDIR